MAVTTSQTSKVFNLHVDPGEITGVFRDMNTALQKATVNALNTVGRAGNRAIATDIKGNYNIKARSLKIGKTVRLIRANARTGRAVFTISILKKGRGLALYSPKKTPAGISVKIKRNRKLRAKSFFIIAKRRGGIRLVARKSKKGGTVQRTSASGTKYMAPKSEFLYGPSIAGLYRRRKSMKILNNTINEKYEKELAEQFNKQFEKKGRR